MLHLNFLFLTLTFSALRAPRRRYSSGGEEDGWSHGLQRVSHQSSQRFI